MHEDKAVILIHCFAKEGKRCIKKRFLFFLLLLSFLCALPVNSQVPPKTKAGAVERGLEIHKLEPEEETSEELILEKEPERLSLLEGEKVLIKEFIFEGNVILSSGFLNKLVFSYINRELSLSQIEEVCEAIALRYHKRGYFLARVILPAQEIKDGAVKLLILEGRLGRIQIDGVRFYSPDFIRNKFHPAKQGAIHHASLLKSLILLNENLGLKVKATLKKGELPQTVDILLDIEDNLPFGLSLDYNNFGSKYNSKHRAGLSTEMGNLLLQGSKLSLRGIGGITDENLWFGELVYQLPLTHYGTKLELSYLKSDFNVGRDFRVLNTGGKSEVYSLGLIHPLIRTRASRLDFLLGFDHKDIENYLLGAVNSDDELSIFRAGLTCNHLDSFGGKNIIDSVISVGIDDMLGALNHDDPLASRAGAGGEFVKFDLDFTRIQKLPCSCFLIVKASGQTASDALPVCEQFYVGGGDSVRGFPIAEYLGDYGYFGGFEVRVPIPFLSELTVPFTKGRKFREFVQMAGFVDHGKVFLKNPQVGQDKDSEISGAGAGLRLNICGFNVSLDWGFRIGGEEPSTGADSVFYISAEKKLF